MTLLQGLCLGGAFVVSLLIGDVLRSHDRDTWPHTVAILLLAVVGGYLQSVLLVSCMAGAALGWLLIGGIHSYLRYSQRRAERHRSRQERAEALRELRRP